MTISYTREVSFDFVSHNQNKPVQQTHDANYQMKVFLPGLSYFLHPLTEHETIPVLLKTQVATCLAILLALSCTYNITLTAYEKQPLLLKLKVATCKGLGVFWKLLFRWKGSIYKLVGGHGVNERR